MHSNSAAHPSEEHLHRHVAHHSPTIPREHKFVLTKLTHRFEHRHRRISQRHAIFSLTFHPPGRNSPHPRFEVHLIPPRADHFASPRRSQDRELRHGRSRRAQQP